MAVQEVVHRRCCPRLRLPHQATPVGRSFEETNSEALYKVGSPSAALLGMHFVAAAVLDQSGDARELCAQEARQGQRVPTVIR